jgi:type I restriction enzyme, S subunit
MPSLAQILDQYFDVAFAAPDGIKKLRELILSLAMQGKLVPQDPRDQSASELLKEIETEKSRLVKEGKIKPSKPLPEIKPDEVPYDLPKSWEWVRLNNALDVRDGTHDTPKYVDVGYPLITSKNLYTGMLSFEDVKLISEEDYRKINDRSKVDIGDILFAMIGSIGNPVIVDCGKEFSIKNVALFKFYLTDKPRSRYLHYFLKQAQEIMKDSSSGAVQSFVSLGFLRNYLIPIPPIAEQRRIVAKIDELMARCDDLEKLRQVHAQKQITVHNAALNQLLTAKDHNDFKNSWHFITQHFGELYSVKANVAELRKAILQLAVMGKLVPQDPNDQHASELLIAIEMEKKRLVKDEGLKTSANEYIEESEKYLGKIDGWEYCRLGNLTRFIDYRGKTPKKVDSGIALITAKNVRSGYINREPYEYLTPSEYESWMTRGFPKIGDILFTTEAPLGNVAIIDIQESFALAQRVICFQLHKPEIADFLQSFMMSEVFQNQLLDNATGMTAKGIKASRLKEIPIPLPPLAEQHRIVAKIDQLMTLCDKLEKQIDTANCKKTNLLNSVMTKV